MILKTAYYDTAAFSALTRENGFIDPIISHTFNEPARCIIRIADPDGSKIQKYDSDAAGDAIYVGSGRAKVYEPDGTLLFDGRIMRSERVGKVTVLTCLDWLSQLDDERVHYDFREDIDGAGLRESYLRSDLSAASCVPVDTGGGPTYRMFDDNMSGIWGNDEWNAYYFVVSGKNAGDITVGLGPNDFDHTGNFDIWPNAQQYENCWTDDSNSADMLDNDAGDDGYLYMDFALHVHTGSLYNSATEMRIKIRCSLEDATNDADFGVLWSDDASKTILGTITNVAGREDIREYTFTIPYHLIDDVLDNDGTVTFFWYIDIQGGGPDTELKIYYAWLELDCNVDGYSTALLLDDTNGNPAYMDQNSVNADYDGLGFWDGMKYSLCQPINNHINGIVTAGDPLVTLTTSVEATTGITTRHLSDRTRLEILQNVAPIDAAVFWLPLASTQMRWKSATDAVSSDLRDHQVLRWRRAGYDFTTYRNQAIIYGINDLSYEYNDTTSQGEYDVTRTEVIKATGVTSEYDAKQLGTGLINRDKTINLQIEADLPGLSAIRLGDWLTVYSDDLGLSGASYIVYHWSYQNDITTIRLQPKSTVGYHIYRQTAEEFMMTPREISKQKIDTYVPNLSTETW